MTTAVQDRNCESEFPRTDIFVYESGNVRMNTLGDIYFKWDRDWFPVSGMFFKLQAMYQLPAYVLEEIKKVRKAVNT